MIPYSTSSHASGSGIPRRARPLLLRLLLLVAAPAVFFYGLEGGLRLIGFGRPTELFIPDEKPGFFRTNPNFTAPFIPPSFELQPLNFRLHKHKPANSIRVFILGESAAQGTPEPDFGFASQLRAQLKARYPGKVVEVFNLGITAINSHVVYQIARQVVDFEPDLLVIYMGNNEVVGPYGPGCPYLSSAPPLWAIRASVWVRSTRTGQLLTVLLGKLSPSGRKAQDWKGMETFSDDSVRGDDPRLETVYQNFSANLQDMLDIAGHAGIRTVLSTVVANLKDSAPFISLHRAGLSPEQARSWQSAFDAGKAAWDLGDMGAAGKEFEEALRIDPQFAEAHFRLGRVEEALGDAEGARRHYLDALHWDALRFRPDPRLNEIIRRIAQKSDGAVFFVDAARAMGSDPDSRAPLSGDEILVDHVHFTWPGNFQVARLLGDACAKGISAPSSNDGLDAGACAAALGYTDDGRLKMLRGMLRLKLSPPFTNQFTFSEDQAKLKREIEGVTARLGTPEAKAAATGAVRQALQLDPGNDSLVVRLQAMEFDAGDMTSALSLLEQAAALQPASAWLPRRKAQILMHLGRYDEAESLLLGSLGLDRYYYFAGDVLVELWSTTGQFDKGKHFFVQELEKSPANHYLRLEYARLLSRGGDWSDAEREARRIWDEAPRSRPARDALELLIELFDDQGRPADAENLSVTAYPYQPFDYSNNQRLLRFYASKRDAAKTVECIQALEASGPFTSGQHLELARRLGGMNRTQEMLDEVGRARVIARIEGDESKIQAADDMADYCRRHFGGEVR